MRIVDLVGRRFGKLKVTELAGRDPHGQLKWLCECDCGGRKVIRGFSLKNGHTKSCGCLPRAVNPELKCMQCKTYKPREKFATARTNTCDDCRKRPFVRAADRPKREVEKKPEADKSALELARMRW